MSCSAVGVACGSMTWRCTRNYEDNPMAVKPRPIYECHQCVESFLVPWPVHSHAYGSGTAADVSAMILL